MVARRVTADRRRRQHRRPRAQRRRPGHVRQRATSSSTRRPPSRSTRRSTRRSRSTCSARRASPQTLNELGVTPHLVAVSTCYVAGNRRGNAPEELVERRPVRPRPQLAQGGRRGPPAAQRHRGREPRPRPARASSRTQRTSELGAAGAPALAAKTEQLRERWVSDQLVEAGRARAASVGWPDAYAYTKALGEQALTETKGTVPVSIVRPSIIESALAEPFPGWIRGFRMAEPVILSYARGLLKEFPGVPEGTVDVIPVDLVVAAIIAVAAVGPEHAPAITQVASGGINPLRYQLLVDNIRAWFSEHPLYDAEGQPIVVPEWVFPAAGGSQEQLKRAKSIAETERTRAAGAAAARQAGGVGGEARGEEGRDRPRLRVRPAVRPVHRVRGDLPGRPPAAHLVDVVARRPGRVQLRSALDRLGRVHHHDPPAVDRAALARQDHTRARTATTAPTGCAAACCRPTATSPRSTSRTRSSRRTSSRATRGWPPAG